MIQDFLQKHDLKSFRETQFNKAYYQQFIENFDELTTWSKDLREKLKAEVEFSHLKVIRQQISKRQDTIKVLFERKSNPAHKIETVLMRHQDGRNTVCVSCMIGCPVGCKFCATGGMGFVGNLSADEIMDQVLYFGRLLNSRKLPSISKETPNKQNQITNIVFMGMGEPLLNLREVLQAIEIITNPQKMAMSPGRVTISTAGIVNGIKQLMKAGYKGRLAISLHAPTQELRQQIMPIAARNPLDKLFDVLGNWTQLTNKRVSYEYILIKGVNDKNRHAEKLAKLLKKKLAHVNLIPYNKVEGQNFESSEKVQIHRFASILERHRVPHSIRVTMGDDIDAACGQLAGKS